MSQTIHEYSFDRLQTGQDDRWLVALDLGTARERQLDIEEHRLELMDLFREHSLDPEFVTVYTEPGDGTDERVRVTLPQVLASRSDALQRAILEVAMVSQVMQHRYGISKLPICEAKIKELDLGTTEPEDAWVAMEPIEVPELNHAINTVHEEIQRQAQEHTQTSS